MADIKVRVGVGLDNDPSALFRPLVESAKRARAQIGADDKRSVQETKNTELAAARDVYREQSKLNRDLFKSQAQMALESSRQVAADANAKIKGNLQLKLEAIKQAAAAERAALAETGRNARDEARRRDREARGNGGSGGGGNGLGAIGGYIAGRRIVSGAASAFTSSIRAGLGFAGQIGRGAGFEVDLGASIGRNVEREKMAIDLANSAYQPGAAGAAGVRQDPAKIRAEANSIAETNALDPTKVLGGLQKYTAISGDLETGRKVMGDLARLSKATGTEFDHMAEAAGNAGAQLADTPDKAEKLSAIMRAIAGQGKLGAVEIKDMAKQMASLAASAPQFAGSAANNITTMGVLAQEARQRGGAKSAAQATTAVASFTNTFSKNARVQEFLAHGINPFDASGKIRDPQQLIVESLKKTKGNTLEMGKMFMDVQARRAVRGFENVYREAGGGDKGIQAVEAEFKRLKDIAMGEGEVRESANKAMESTASKAQLFQNKLDGLTENIQADLLPSLIQLSPVVLKAVEVFGGVAKFAANNPFLAIAGATGAGAIKAGLGEILSRAMMGGGTAAASGAGGLAGAGGAGAIVGATFAATAAIVALGLAADQAGKLWNETHAATTFAAGTSPEEQARLLGLTREQKQAELAAHGNKADLEAGGYQTDDKDRAGPIDPRVATAVDPKRLLELNEQQLKALQSELRVRITNADEINQASGDKPQPPGLNAYGTTKPYSSASDESSSEATSGGGI